MRKEPNARQAGGAYPIVVKKGVQLVDDDAAADEGGRARFRVNAHDRDLRRPSNLGRFRSFRRFRHVLKRGQ